MIEGRVACPVVTRTLSPHRMHSLDLVAYAHILMQLIILTVELQRVVFLVYKILSLFENSIVQLNFILLITYDYDTYYWI